MQLPNADKAYINHDKLKDYSLNLEHPRGKHKARLFAAILALKVEDIDDLKVIILDAIKRYDTTLGNLDQYGQRYIVDFPVSRNSNTAIVRTIWIVRVDETFPRLVSCYILR
ncbi:MAG: DUF6883 domain-containing protein [Cyanobacteria bacterium J06554_6]